MDELRLVEVASLMHDIGKVMQRAVVQTKREFDHSKLSEAFFHKEEQTGIKYKEDEAFMTALKFLVGHHHEKYLNSSEKTGKLRLLAEIISEGDNLSSGEREEIDEPPGVPLLIPILAEVNLENKLSSPNNFYYKVQPLQFKQKVNLFFDSKNPAPEDEIEKSYKKLWQAFLSDYKELVSIHDGTLMPDSIFYLLQKYFWCVPSAFYKTYPDISLFEHSKVTAAFSTSLYRYFVDMGHEVLNIDSPKEIRNSVKNRSEGRYLFAVIDVNGIQNFIYSVSSKKGLLSLKGRSLFVEILSEAINRYFLWDKQINLFESNIIYSGGGKSYLLLPLSVKNRFLALKSQLEEFLFREFKGKLMVSIGMLGVSANEMSRDGIESTWKNLMQQLSIDRQHKLRDFSETNYEEMFSPVEAGGFFSEDGEGSERAICKICRKETTIDKAGEEENYCICKECKSYLKLAEDSFDSNFLLFSTSEFSGYTDYVGNLETSRIYFGFTKKPLNLDMARSIVFNVADTNNVLNDFGKIAARGFYLYGSRNMNNNVRDLENLIENSQGIKRLGIIRMDIDNLGEILIKGLESERKTLSRLSQISSSISIFFKGNLNVLVDEQSPTGNRFKDTIQIIYAGGDDLFAVGSWNTIPEFANLIQKEFSKYSCDNPSLTLSAGISMITSKYPLYRGALFAGKMEDKAKSYEFKKESKNAIAFLGSVLSWHDFEIAICLRDILVESISQASKNGDQSKRKAVLRKLQSIYNAYLKEKMFYEKKFVSREEIISYAKWSRWMWLLAYNIGREKENREYLLVLRDALIRNEVNYHEKHLSSNEEILSYLSLPIKWADYLTRTDKRR